MSGTKVDKKTVIAALEEIALLLELSGANPFKVRAFANGARALQGYEGDLAEGYAAGELAKLKGVGKGILAEVAGLLEQGESPGLTELREKVPPGLLEMVRIPGLGPKRARRLHEELGIASLGELEYACNENRLLKLEGFGAKTQEKILAGIQYVRRFAGRHLLSDAWAKAEDLLERVRALPPVERAEVAGSIRRRKETIKDVDILAVTASPKEVAAAFVAFDGVEEVIGQGDTKASVRLDSGIQVDLRMVDERAFPFALHYFTGSKEHNTAMRSRAKARGLKLNEYGLFPRDSEESLPAASEGEIFAALELRDIPPELREDRGEIQAAEGEGLPELLRERDLRGALHNHSTYSDGAHTIEEMARAAQALGWEYIGMADHSESAFYAHGLSGDDILRQHEEIDRLNETLEGFTILKGIESDILADGSLDYDEETLARFDFVVASIHSRFGLDGAAQTERCIRAVQNPFTSVLGHPTGRLLLAREGFAVDMDAVLDAAAEVGCAVELNANPRRLDLDWRDLRAATGRGLLVSIGPDAHRTEGLEDLRYGVAVARKGWLTKEQALNSRTAEELLALFAGKRQGL